MAAVSGPPSAPPVAMLLATGVANMTAELIARLESADGPNVDAEIARIWPARWAKANAARPGASKRRTNLRKAFRQYQAHTAFVASNPDARCGNCAHVAMKHTRDQPHCELDSDYYGDQLVKLDGVCTRWIALAAAALKARGV